MKPIEIVRLLKEAKNAKEKEPILKNAWETESFDFFEGCQYAFDPSISFGENEIPFILDEDDEPDELGRRFFLLLNSLKNQSVVGEHANKSIDDACQISSVEAWNEWYRKILLKEIDFVTVAQINKVLNKEASTNLKATKYIIPVFGFQKVYDFQDTMLVGHAFIDEFKQGTRAVAFLNKKGHTVLYTDRGKKILDDISLQLSSLSVPVSIVLDGVISDGTYWPFDLLPLDEYKKGFSIRDQEERHKTLCEMEYLFQDLPLVKILPKKKINLSDTDGFEKYKEELQQEGIEKVVIKESTAPYQFRKSDNWLKLYT